MRKEKEMRMKILRFDSPFYENKKNKIHREKYSIYHEEILRRNVTRVKFHRRL